jgi:phosphoglycolate phosphatase-like HAD superfamily hydrolase
MYVCLFDIDGTLLASGGAGKAAMEAALVTAFGVAEPIRHVEYSGRTDRAIGRDLFQLHGVRDEADNWPRFVGTYLRHLPNYLAKHQGRIMPGIPVLLERLRAQEGVAVGLLTGNLREGARLKLGHYDLFHHFAFGGFGDHHLCRDDVAREALAAVRQHLNGDGHPERIWVIGDTPLDIRCARAIGARVAAVATGWHTLEQLAAAEPDLLLADFSDPEPFLERIREEAKRLSEKGVRPLGFRGSDPFFG